MNRKQLTLLIVLAVALGGLGWLANQRRQSSFDESKVRLGEKVLPDFPINDVARFSIKQAKAETTIARKDDIWTVVERENYPANFATISEFLRKFWRVFMNRSSRRKKSGKAPAWDFQPCRTL